MTSPTRSRSTTSRTSGWRTSTPTRTRTTFKGWSSQTNVIWRGFVIFIFTFGPSFKVLVWKKENGHWKDGVINPSLFSIIIWYHKLWIENLLNKEQIKWILSWLIVRRVIDHSKALDLSEDEDIPFYETSGKQIYSSLASSVLVTLSGCILSYNKGFTHLTFVSCQHG